MSEATRYEGWSKDRQGWFMGQTAGTWITGVAMGLPVLLGIGAHRWLFVLAWLPVWAVVVALVTVPVRGRSAARWAKDSVIKLIGDGMRWTPWQSRGAAGQVKELARPTCPGCWPASAPTTGRATARPLVRVALVQNSITQTWAVVARISHPGIGLAELDERDQMGSGLSELLEDAATGELVDSIAVQVRTVPDDGAERAAWQRQNLRARAPHLSLEVNAVTWTPPWSAPGCGTRRS